MASVLDLLPASYGDFLSYINGKPNTPLSQLVRPYNQYEAKLRELYAQDRNNSLLQDPHINAIPVFDGHEQDMRIRAREFDNPDHNKLYIMPLRDEDRKPTGALSVVPSLDVFKSNFSIFSESSLDDLDWKNVVVAGSAVVTALLPVPDKQNESKRALRQYYHEELAPSSDVDLFLWGLDEEAAVEKVKQVERRVRDAILSETTTIRTKNAITIVSQYPTRHVQIVLRLYKSVSEILNGFDVDCSCFAFDGNQVYGTPRGIAAFMTQCNTIDLSRRSPSYESRLSKYARRGFEIFCPILERHRVDPTIFERSFARVQGLAKLLVLERLPKESDRESYLNQRRLERGRPAINMYARRRRTNKLKDNLKDRDPEDVAEWDFEDDVSNYHSFTIPYGPRFNAKKIERLLFTKDVLLNAEWNAKPDRTVNLHRHPCFIGDAEFVVKDCCTTCPVPATDEEKGVAEEERKIFVYGDLEFMKDNPGRQTIGSFHPLTSENWTEQAYLGHTEALCLAIINDDLSYIEQWISTSLEADLNRRDHTGRTPLQLACQSASPRIVKCLVDAGARLIARLADGLTPLHIACIRGNPEIVRILLERSEANEESEAEKEGRVDRGKVSHASGVQGKVNDTKNGQQDGEDELTEKSDEDNLVDGSEDSESVTHGSFVKIKASSRDEEEVAQDGDDEPDIYNIDVLAWDSPVSPLHLSIIKGHLELVHLLVSHFGADVLLPVKLVDEYTRSPRAAIMTLVLSAQHPEMSVETSRALLKLGASPSQSDMSQHTALEYSVALNNIEVVKAMFDEDPAKAKTAINHVSNSGYRWSMQFATPLVTAIECGNPEMALELMKHGADTTIPFQAFANAYVAAVEAFHSWRKGRIENKEVKEKFEEHDHPIVKAVMHGLPSVVEVLLDEGIDVNTLTKDGRSMLRGDNNRYNPAPGKALLDVLEDKINQLEDQIKPPSMLEPPTLEEDDAYFLDMDNNSYQFLYTKRHVEQVKNLVQNWSSAKDKIMKENYSKEKVRENERRLEIKKALADLKERLVSSGAKRFAELYPDVQQQTTNQSGVQITPNKTRTKKLKFEPWFSLPELDEERRKQYVKLFEAAWLGDLAAVKDMTMKSSGGSAPLKIAVRDAYGFSPFSLALARGHLDLAEVALEIARIQYQPDGEEAKSRRRYFIAAGDSEEEEDYDDGCEERIPISSELVDNEFTLDDVGGLPKLTESKVISWKILTWTPSFWILEDLPEHEAKASWRLFNRGDVFNLPNLQYQQDAIEVVENGLRQASGASSLFDYAIHKGDLGMVRWLLRLGAEHRLPQIVDPSRAFWNECLWHQHHYLTALALGHTAIASELVVSTGIGLPYEELAKESGLEDPRKPQYYQGLLLRGKYRKDWAKEAQQPSARPSTTDRLRSPPLLRAIYDGNIQSVEWLLSDTPGRLLQDFLRNRMERNSILSQAHDKTFFDDMVNGWLSTRRELAIHMAVLNQKWTDSGSQQREEASKLLDYLIKVIPESLETKSASGHTPLSLAYSAQRYEAAKMLMAAGANQAVRDNVGRNILHLALRSKSGVNASDSEQLDSFLALIDKRLIVELLQERCSEAPTGITPVARWLRSCETQQSLIPSIGWNENEEARLSMFEVLLKYADDQTFRLMDGSGQLPIHTCIMNGLQSVLTRMTAADPDLVYMENAMGQTAIELATTLYVRHMATNAPSLEENRARQDGEMVNHHYHTMRILLEAADKSTLQSRTLVSIGQASEVAKRLAQAGNSPADEDRKQRRRRRFYYGYNDEEDCQDEVNMWT